MQEFSNLELTFANWNFALQLSFLQVFYDNTLKYIINSCLFQQQHVKIQQNPLKLIRYSGIIDDDIEGGEYMTAVFIGHGECYGLTKEQIKSEVVKAINSGVTEFLNGGQGSFDWIIL